VTRGNLNTATLAQTGKNPSRTLPAILITLIYRVVAVALSLITPNRSQVVEISWF